MTEETMGEGVANSAAGVEAGAVVQVGRVGGDVNVHVGPAPETHEEPLIVTVTRHGMDFVVVDKWEYVETGRVPEPRASRRPSPFDADWAERGRFYDILPWGKDLIKVLVEGRGAQAVVLDSLRPVVVSRRPPREMRNGAVAAGILDERPFYLSLESEPPRLAAGGPDFPFTVTAGDPELFVIETSAAKHEIEWGLELTWRSAGRGGVVTIPEDGAFRIYPV
jgi:hypothetical protein